jgi:hypothetical protein
MSDFEPEALRDWLIDHDVRLRPPAEPRAMAALLSAFDGAVHPDVIAMYLTFDGCEQSDFEADSFLTVWSIEMGLEYIRERGIRDRMAFADVECAADVALCAVTTPDAPVTWHDGILPTNASFGAFWNVVMRGDVWKQ